MPETAEYLKEPIERARLLHFYRKRPLTLPYDQELDFGLIGAGFRYRPGYPGDVDVRPVYNYMVLLTQLPAEVIAELLLCSDLRPAPIVMVPVDETHDSTVRRHFWREVNRARYVVWQWMPPAIIGLSKRADGPPSPLFEYAKALSVIESSIDISYKSNSRIMAQRYFDNTIGNVWMGEKTPFFLQRPQ